MTTRGAIAGAEIGPNMMGNGSVIPYCVHFSVRCLFDKGRPGWNTSIFKLTDGLTKRYRLASLRFEPRNSRGAAVGQHRSQSWPRSVTCFAAKLAEIVNFASRICNRITNMKVEMPGCPYHAFLRP
ncbi:hypothetical protein NXC24_PB00041 (plasmid) [Rhizobium sp. NXC24]|nr:hypothetical protein NXC24_PB00041 [Rhizobium sp. NXC24]